MTWKSGLLAVLVLLGCTTEPREAGVPRSSARADDAVSAITTPSVVKAVEDHIASLSSLSAFSASAVATIFGAQEPSDHTEGQFVHVSSAASYTEVSFHKGEDGVKVYCRLTAPVQIHLRDLEARFGVAKPAIARGGEHPYGVLGFKTGGGVMRLWERLDLPTHKEGEIAVDRFEMHWIEKR
jgi:hypothetical protein